MNGPFVVAQAGSSSSNSAKAPVQIIKIKKPALGETEIYHASFTGTVKIDLTDIANEKITFYKDQANQSLHILFMEGGKVVSQAIIEPFFDSMGVLSNLTFDVGPGPDLDAQQFSSQFTFQTDPSVLPAAGPASPLQGSLEFAPAVVDPLAGPEPLPLLPPEELPTFVLHESIGTLPTTGEEEINLIPAISGKVTFIVEEEELSQQLEFSDAGNGNEDYNDQSGNDQDQLGTDITTNIVTGTGELANLVLGGNPPNTFFIKDVGGQPVTGDHGPVTSLGLPVKYVFISSTEIQGWTFDNQNNPINKIFTLDLSSNGAFTFTLNDQIDHFFKSTDPGSTSDGNLEETLFIDLSIVVGGQDANGDPIELTEGMFTIGVIDDTPFASLSDASLDTLVLDESPANQDEGGDFDPAGLNTITANFANNFAAPAYGADGPGSTSYALVLTGSNVPSGLFALGVNSAQGASIVLNQAAPGADIIGTVGAVEYFRISIDPVTGDVTFSQTTNVWHANTGSDDDTSTLTLANAADLQVVQTVIDFDGDSATAPLNIGAGVFQIEDDGPDAAVANATAAAIVLDETRPLGTDSVGGVAPTGVASATGDFSANFAAADFGTDGAGSVSYKLTLSGEGIGSGLFALDPTDTETVIDPLGKGLQILLYVNDAGTVITGSTSATEGGIDAGNTYFTITVDNNPASLTFGDVTFAQTQNIWHDDVTNHDDPETLATALATDVQLVQTVTDADGDSDSAAINLGANVFTIQDDGPDAAVANATAAAIVLDETRPLGTDSVGGVAPTGRASATGDFSANFAAADFGTDGAGSVSYKLTLSGEGIGSGLFALDPTDTETVIDPLGKGLQILLYVNDAGTVITGSTSATEGGIDAGNTYFTITVDNNPVSLTFGDVTFAQTQNIWHDDVTNHDDPETLATALATDVQLVQTVTDADGDSDSAAINLGANVFTIQDDGPDAAVANATAAAIVLDETRPLGTDSVGGVAPTGVASATGDFSANFAAADFGTDGAGSVSYKLTLSGEGIGSGLFALDPTDTETVIDPLGKGLQILLYVNDAGTVITGSTSATEGGIDAGNTYFTITVDNNPVSPTFGDVTFAQTQNIWHDDVTNHDDPETLATALATDVQLVQTVTDADGDSDSAAINLGANVFTIQDDGPDAAVANATAAAIVLDETRPLGTDSVGGVAPTGRASATGDFSANFAAADFGTDGAGSVSYKLTLSGEGIGSGLFALDPTDTETVIDPLGKGLQILLYVNDAGTVITGSTSATEGGIDAGNTYFTITVDNNPASLTFGDVTFAQTQNIWHDDVTNHDDPETLATALATDVQLVQTVTDADGDSDSAAINLGANVFTIQDDGPALLAKTNLVYANVDNGPGDVGGTGIYDYTIGTDSRTSYDSTHSDFLPITLSGNVGGVAIASPTVTWASEDAGEATFDVSFFYAPDPSSPGTTVEATGTLTFDKAAGTYNLLLDQPIASVTVLQTSEGLSFVGYTPGTDTADNTQPGVMVTKLADDFFVQFTGQESVGGGNPVIVSSVTPPNSPPGDITFTQGDYFAAADTWVSVSGAANGVAGDTLQRGEILNYTFFATDPHGHLDHTDFAAAPTMFLKLDTYNNEDFLVNLKVVDVGANGVVGGGDDGPTQYLLLVVDATDVYTQANPPSGGFNITFDSNDGAIIIQNNDYAGFLGAGNWQIEGAQVLVASGLVSGTGVNFNGLTTFDDDTATDGASTATQAFGPQAEQDTLKISDIGLITSVTTTQNGDLQFGVTNIDADGDTTATSTLDVQITGTTMNGTSSADVLQSSAGNETMTGNGGPDFFVLDGHSLSPNVGAGGHDTLADFLSGTDDILVDIASQPATVGTSTVISDSGPTTDQFQTSNVFDETNANAWNESTATNKFFFNETSDELWYSANGTGSDRIDLAHISTGVVAATDIHTF